MSKDPSFLALCVCEAFFVELKGVVGVCAPDSFGPSRLFRNQQYL